MKKLLAIGVLAAALCGACSHPKFITNMTSRAGDKTFKAITIQPKTFGQPEWGVVKCVMSEDGALSQCRTMTMTFNYD
jgi:hypothetical protein